MSGSPPNELLLSLTQRLTKALYGTTLNPSTFRSSHFRVRVRRSDFRAAGHVAREVAYQGLSLFGGASSELRRCKCSVVVKARASFLPEIYLSIFYRDRGKKTSLKLRYLRGL